MGKKKWYRITGANAAGTEDGMGNKEVLGDVCSLFH